MKKLYQLEDVYGDVLGFFKITEKEAALISFILNKVIQSGWTLEESEDIVFYESEE